MTTGTTTITHAELFAKYAEGPDVLAAALARVPEGALSWRPEPAEWAVDEIIWHCADIEALFSARLRFFLALDEPPIIGLDQDVLADAQRHHGKPTGPAMDFVRAARALDLITLKQIPDDVWGRTGRHLERGPWTLEDWLRIISGHLHVHARQIEQNIAAWHAREGQG